MGSFSKLCAKTNLPIAAQEWQADAPRLCDVVMVFPNGSHVRGIYDGYGMGRADDFDQAKLVLASEYRGERYGDLGESAHDQCQGHPGPTAFARELNSCGGFASPREYNAAVNEIGRAERAARKEAMASLGLVLEAGKGDWELMHFFENARYLEDDDDLRHALKRLEGVTNSLARKTVADVKQMADAYETAVGPRLDAAAAQIVSKHAMKPEMLATAADLVRHVDAVPAPDAPLTRHQAVSQAAIRELSSAWTGAAARGVGAAELRADLDAVIQQLQQLRAGLPKLKPEAVPAPEVRRPRPR